MDQGRNHFAVLGNQEGMDFNLGKDGNTGRAGCGPNSTRIGQRSHPKCSRTEATPFSRLFAQTQALESWPV